MRSRPATVIAWSLCGLTLALATGAGVLSVAYSGTDWGAILPAGVGPSGQHLLPSLLDVAWLTAFAVVGALVASHRPRHPIGWMLGAIPFTLGSIFSGEAVYFHAAQAEGGEPGMPADLCLWLANWAWVPAVILVLVFLPLLFPTGRPPSRRWRIVAWAAAASGVLMASAEALATGPLENYDWVDNPLGAGWMPGWASGVGFGLWLLTALAAVASVVVRFRRAHGAEREQLKWFATAAALLAVAFALSFSLTSVIGDDAGWSLIAFALFGVAVAVAIAILRYRLYDIDVVINRALVYGALTATLGGAYLALVLLVGLAVGRSNLAIAVSTLAVAALFRPARASIQAAVDRRFYRRRYDAGRTLEAFGLRLRDELDLEALGSDLRAVVSQTVQPAHVSLWLPRNDSRTHGP
jgi:hypothetical protein